MSRKLPSLRWAAGGLLVAGLLTKVLGVVRQILIASIFGAGAGLDAVFLGLSLPLAITIGAGGGFARAAVPVAAALDDSRFAGLWRHALRRLVTILAPATLLLAVTAPLWSRLLVQGHSSTFGPTLTMAAAAGSLALLGGTLGGLCVGLVNARGKHVSASLNPIVYNIVQIAAIALLHRSIGPMSVLVAVVLAEWVQFLVQAPILAFMADNAVPEERPRDWSRLKALFWPSAVMGIASGLNVVVDRSFATQLAEGSISALTYADSLLNLPVGLLGSAIAVPLFTRLSLFQSENRREDFHTTLLLGIRLFLLAGAPMAVMLTALCQPLIGVLFARGAFTAKAVELSSVAMQGYAAGLVFQALTGFLVSVGLTLRRPWWVVAVMLLTTGLNALLDHLFVKPLGLFGIALATSIVAFVRVGMMLVLIDARAMADRALWQSAIRAFVFSVLLAAPMSLIGWAAHALGISTFAGRAAVLCLGGVVALAVTALLWKRLLRHEWNSLSRLRKQAANSVLAPAPRRRKRA